ncbi:MAG: hypothetical protein KAU48_12880 [Candidatus Thorarchaeota archaeon]|nr:hypothetical protein [Candidatus Thorarchaeota archaeon]
MDRSSKRLAILLILGFFTGSMTLTFFSEGVDASSLSIIDYDYEGIAADSTQYFALLIHGSQPVDLTVNASVLEFVGSSGWPQLEMRIFEFQDYNYTEGYLAICWSSNNYTCRLSYQAANDSRYVLAVSNLDPVDDAVYNLTISSTQDIDFQYTAMYELDDVSNPQDNTISITYFESTNPYLYRLENSGTSRIVVQYMYDSTDEIYFFIINKGETCDLFVGLLGIPFYTDYPDLTSFVIDFEDYGQEDREILYLWTISNFSTGGTFECESGHRYNFWIDFGYYTPDLYIIFDSFGEEDLNFDADLLASNPEDEISIRFSFTDPWVEFQNLSRDAWNWVLGIGGSVGACAIFSIWYLRRRYN